VADWRDVADRVVEAPVVTSYTRIGPAVRRRMDGWRPLGSYRLDGRVVVVTGATSGLGRAAAARLAGCGATLVLVGRDAAKAERVRDELASETGNDGISVAVADVGDLAAVRALAASILAGHDRLDVLIHNAGALSATRREGPDGTELTVASQVVGPFLLTALLLERLVGSAPSRVLTMSSGGMYTQPLTVEELEMSPETYRGSVAYARAKRAQVTLNEQWAERLAGTGLVFQALHPGWADTPGVRESLPGFRRMVGPLLRTPDEGADTLVWLAADDGEPLAGTGRFWLDRRPRPIHLLPATRRSDTPERRRELWDYCVDRAGLGGAIDRIIAAARAAGPS